MFENVFFYFTSHKYILHGSAGKYQNGSTAFEFTIIIAGYATQLKRWQHKGSKLPKPNKTIVHCFDIYIIYWSPNMHGRRLHKDW